MSEYSLTIEEVLAECVRKHEAILALRALVSWIDGMCVDYANHAEIRAGIDRWRESQNG